MRSTLHEASKVFSNSNNPQFFEVVKPKSYLESILRAQPSSDNSSDQENLSLSLTFDEFMSTNLQQSAFQPAFQVKPASCKMGQLSNHQLSDHNLKIEEQEDSESSSSDSSYQQPQCKKKIKVDQQESLDKMVKLQISSSDCSEPSKEQKINHFEEIRTPIVINEQPKSKILSSQKKQSQRQRQKSEEKLKSQDYELQQRLQEINIEIEKFTREKHRLKHLIKSRAGNKDQDDDFDGQMKECPCCRKIISKLCFRCEHIYCKVENCPRKKKQLLNHRMLARLRQSKMNSKKGGSNRVKGEKRLSSSQSYSDDQSEEFEFQESSSSEQKKTNKRKIETRKSKNTDSKRKLPQINRKLNEQRGKRQLNNPKSIYESDQ